MGRLQCRKDNSIEKWVCALTTERKKSKWGPEIYKAKSTENQCWKITTLLVMGSNYQMKLKSAIQTGLNLVLTVASCLATHSVCVCCFLIVVILVTVLHTCRKSSKNKVWRGWCFADFLGKRKMLKVWSLFLKRLN